MTVHPANMDDDDRRPRQQVYAKMEQIIKDMQHPEKGVPVRCQKMFLTTIPSAFTGSDLITWLNNRLQTDDPAESRHLANLLRDHGYILPITDNKYTLVKDDHTLYRFQSPYFWPTHHWKPDNVDYAIYLAKRTMRNKQRHGLDEHEQVAFNKLQKMLCDKWDFIYMQAEQQVRLAKDRKKADRLVIDSHERAFWRVHRPPPGQVCCIDEGVRRISRLSQINQRKKPTIESCMMEIAFLNQALTQHRLKVSKAAECLTGRCELYQSLDPFLCPPQPSNPWVTDETTLWVLNSCLSESPTEARVQRWGFSFEELLADKAGRVEFEHYLETEYSVENIRFWNAAMELRRCPQSKVESKVQEIYKEFLSSGAPQEINIDSKTMELTQEAMKTPSRYTFDAAQSHIFLLMKKDSYPRFLRSEQYKQLQVAAQNPSPKKKFFSFGTRRKSPNPSPTPSPRSKRRGSAESDAYDRKSVGVLSQHSFSTGNLRELESNRVNQSSPFGSNSELQDNGKKSNPWKRLSPRSVRRKLEQFGNSDDSPGKSSLEVPRQHTSGPKTLQKQQQEQSNKDINVPVHISVPNQESNVVAPWDETP